MSVTAQLALDLYEPRTHARTTDPATSQAAAKVAAYRAGSHKAILLAAYAVRALTDEEAAEATGLTLYAATKRCADLRHDGMIAATQTLRRGASGVERMVCAITADGVAALGGGA